MLREGMFFTVELTLGMPWVENKTLQLSSVTASMVLASPLCRSKLVQRPAYCCALVSCVLLHDLIVSTTNLCGDT